MIKSLFYFLLLLLLSSSCRNSNNLATISVSETAGLDRQLEYIKATVPLNRELSANEMLVLTNVEHDATMPLQEVKLLENDSMVGYSIVFPLEISANQTKTYQVRIQEKMRSSLPVQLLLSEDKLSVENQYFKIYFSSEDDERGGQINGIELKDFGNQLLKRGHISMHWAPNFSKSDSENYFNMEDLLSESENSVEREFYSVKKKRSGTTDSVPEIYVEGRYEFYSDLPYFLFESTMTMEKDVELDLLRNDEMTLDSLFTHVTYPKNDGTISHLELYDELDVLDDNPIADDADWVAFYNLDKGFGFGSIRLDYDNNNVDGQPSPTHRPYTKISRASGNGRYWNRVLTDTILSFPKGSRFQEKNAYLIFSVDPNFPEKEILHYFRCLKHPLKVEIGVNG